MRRAVNYNPNKKEYKCELCGKGKFYLVQESAGAQEKGNIKDTSDGLRVDVVDNGYALYIQVMGTDYVDLCILNCTLVGT